MSSSCAAPGNTASYFRPSEGTYPGDESQTGPTSSNLGYLQVTKTGCARYERVVAGSEAPVRRPPRKGTVVSNSDKANNKAEETKGKVKEAAGRAVGNERLEAEGKADQTTADVKQAGEKVKDAAKSLKP